MAPDRIRARTLILASTVCVLTMLAAAAWIGRGGHREKPAQHVSASAAAVEPEALSTPLTTERERVDLSPTVAVVSRANLPIQHVWLAGADGVWKIRRLNDGRIDRDELLDAVRACAPGHLPATLNGHVATIVLDVDAMLILRMPGLKAQLSSVSPSRDLPSGGAGCAGFLDDDRIGCAVARELQPAGTPEQRGVAFDLSWNDRLSTRVRFRPQHAGVVEWRASAPIAPPTSDLRMHIVRRGETEHCSFKIEGRVEPSRTVSSSSGGFGPDSTPLNAVVELAWGDISTRSTPFQLQRDVGRREEEVRFSGIPNGAGVSIVAHDDDTHAWACFEGLHEGLEHDLELRPALTLKSVISPPASGPAPERISIEWLQRFRQGDDPAWTTRPGTYVPTDDGSWRIKGPGRIRLGSAMSSVVPPLCEVRITSPGFLPVIVNATVSDAPVIELEAVKLEPLAPDFWIRPLSVEGLCGIAFASEIDALDRSGHMDALRVARVWLEADGRIAVCCRRIDRRGETPRPDTIARTMIGAVRLVTNPTWHELRQFTLRSDLTFDEEATVEYRLEFTPPKGPHRMKVRLVWNDVECESILLTPSRKDLVSSRWKVPAGPVHVEWRCTELRSEWKSEPVSLLRQRFDRFECSHEKPDDPEPTR